jgi:hypothetical protein
MPASNVSCGVSGLAGKDSAGVSVDISVPLSAPLALFIVGCDAFPSARSWRVGGGTAGRRRRPWRKNSVGPGPAPRVLLPSVLSRVHRADVDEMLNATASNVSANDFNWFAGGAENSVGPGPAPRVLLSNVSRSPRSLTASPPCRPGWIGLPADLAFGPSGSLRS